jgi:predicted porin
MNKKILALAIGAAFASPAAFAATGNVDIYGQLTLSVDYLNTDASSPADDNLLRVSSNSSRIGFKGSEDLGDGLKAVWQIESQLNMDGGTANTAGPGGALGPDNFSTNLRNTYVGIAGGFGTVLLGKHDTPYKLGTAKLDIFADTAGDYNNIVGNVNGSNAFDLRPGNVIAYISPMFSGFHAAVAYVAGAEVSNGSAGDFDAWSVMGMYENGPLFASLAYERHNRYNASGGSPAGSFSTTAFISAATSEAETVHLVFTTPSSPATSGDDRSSWKLGLAYSFGDAKVGFIYENSEADGKTTTDRDAWYLNGSYKLGNIVLKAAYGHAGDGDSTGNTKASTWVIGADYNFSKRTMVYALYAATDNKSGGTYGIGAGQGSTYTPASSGQDPSVISLGVRHVF